MYARTLPIFLIIEGILVDNLPDIWGIKGKDKSTEEKLSREQGGKVKRERRKSMYD